MLRLQAMVGIKEPRGPDMRVLIHSGAGGVGSIAVQIAKAWGCHVTATCGPKNMEFVKQVSGQFCVRASVCCLRAHMHSIQTAASTVNVQLC